MLRFIYWLFFGSHDHHWYVIETYYNYVNCIKENDDDHEHFDRIGYIVRCSKCGELKQEEFDVS